MTQFQNAWTQASKALEHKQGKQGSDDQQSEDATMTAAGKLAKVTGHRLSREQKKKAGPVVHYGFGTAVGGLYGLAYEFAPRSVKGLHPVVTGSGYGTALFVGADEGRSPCLWPFTICKRSSTECAFVRWASHLVYGLTLEMVRKTVRQNL